MDHSRYNYRGALDMDTSVRQLACLETEVLKPTIIQAGMDIFDEFTAIERKRIRNSPFNICILCLYNFMHDKYINAIEALEFMEAEIRG